MRNKKLAWNSLSGLILQVTTVLCGFILPRAILNRFGSDVNGLLNSIAQFLQMIAFLELGVGAVVQSALYKPLANRDENAISEVLASGTSFFRKLAAILVLYIIALMFVFPTFIDKKYGFVYDATLILSMSISYFAQYYFGIIDGLLLKADQKAYIINMIDMVTLIINTAFCYCLLYFGFTIQVVKFATAGIFLFRPLLVRLYIRRNYRIDRKCKFRKEAVQQKWNGVAQHVAAIVLDSTDVVVLSVFSDMYAVSVYSVYLIVVSGVKSLIVSCFGGIRSLFGELWAKQERKELDSYFGSAEWIIHALSVFVWCCTYNLIVPFVLIYTEHMTDVDYNVPVFSALICLAYALYCLRLPFHFMVQASGHYKDTQNIYIVGAVMNLSLSILAVNRWGLIGVTIGTIAAMLYQLLHTGYYVIKHLKVSSWKRSVKQILFDVFAVALVLTVTSMFSGSADTWLSWIFLAVRYSAVIAVCILVANLVFYNEATMRIFKKIFIKKH